MRFVQDDKACVQGTLLYAIWVRKIIQTEPGNIAQRLPSRNVRANGGFYSMLCSVRLSVWFVGSFADVQGWTLVQ